MEACITSHSHIVKYLLQQFREDIDVWAVDNGGGNAYHYAACNDDNVKIAKKLLAVDGSRVNVGSKRGWTPLHRASYNGNTHMVEFLLNAGGDADAVNRDGLTPDQITDNDEIISLIREHRKK